MRPRTEAVALITVDFDPLALADAVNPHVRV